MRRNIFGLTCFLLIACLTKAEEADYTELINGRLQSLFDDNALDILILSEEYPELLNTSALDAYISGWVKKYGPNRAVDLELTHFVVPVIGLIGTE